MINLHANMLIDSYPYLSDENEYNVNPESQRNG